MTLLAQKFVEILRTARGQQNALTSLDLGRRAAMDGSNGAVTREVRRIVAEEHRAMQAALLPSVLLACAPHGYWLAEDAEEVRRRYLLLNDLATRATEKAREFQRVAGAAGFGAKFLNHQDAKAQRRAA